MNASAADWIHWRGPEQNGVSREKDLPAKWSPDPKAPDNNLVWKKPYGCRSTALVMGDRLYIINTAGKELTEQERVMCLNASTGDLIWEHRFNVFHTAIVSNRLGWTNLTGDPETGNVYAHGTQGLLMCLSKEGKLLWQHSLTEEYGRISGYGGRLCSPIVDGDLCIIGMVQGSWGDFARGRNRFAAFDKKTGAVVWWSDPCSLKVGTYYSVPVVTNINGQRLLISGAADGSLVALKVRTGEKVWSYVFGDRPINASPVVGPDGKVYCNHGLENPEGGTNGRIICVDATKVKDGQPQLVWKVPDIKADYASPILHEGRLYIADDSGRLFAFNAQTGEKVWKRPHKFGLLTRGSAVLADNKIYLAEVNAKFHILSLDKKGQVEDDHFVHFPGPAGEGFVEVNSTPAVVNGRIYFGTRDEFYCIGKTNHKTPAGAIPEPAKEDPVAKDAKVAHLQVVPGDVVLAPGESATFKVRAFDDGGRFLKEIPMAEWSLPKPPVPMGAKEGPPPLAGEVKDGKLTLAKDRPLQQGYVQAKVGELTAWARVRVVPPLPMKFDFSKVPEGRTPAGWVNCAGKFVMEVLPDGTHVLKKLAPQNGAPPVARADAFIGLPNMTDYTIQSDVLGRQVDGNLPDMGIGANRYTMLLEGKRDADSKKRTIMLASWNYSNEYRVVKQVPFDWNPDTWYRMKLTVDLQKDKGIIRGKVWPADKPEPAEWTMVFEDPMPNREGAPALYGYAPGIVAGTEALYNNVSVTPNSKTAPKK